MNYKIESFEGYKESESYRNDIEWLSEKNQISNDPKVLKLLEGGAENFYIDTANRIDKELRAKLFYNYCDKCNQLARTPYSRQCKNCHHNWHYKVKANFRINYIIRSEIELGKLNFVGKVINGFIEKDLLVDLTFLGLAYRKPIEIISVLIDDNKLKSEIVFSISILDFEDTLYLLNFKNIVLQIIEE